MWRPGPDLPESRFRHAVVATGSHLYVVGGATEINDVAVARATVFYAPIQNSGQLGAWNETTTLPQSRYYHSAVIHDNRIVVLGGTNGESDFASVPRHPSMPMGPLGVGRRNPPCPPHGPVSPRSPSRSSAPITSTQSRGWIPVATPTARSITPASPPRPRPHQHRPLRRPS